MSCRRISSSPILPNSRGGGCTVHRPYRSDLRAHQTRSLCRAGPAVPEGADAGQDDQMDSHDGRRDPDSALIMEGIRALHDRLDRLERRIVPSERILPGERAGPGERRSVPAWKRPTEGETRWQVALAVAAAVALQYPLPGRLVLVHPFWLLPTLQALLLIALVAANPRRLNTESRAIRFLGLTLAVLLSLANAY